eukprot:scaffold68242_cov41-Cyclotella_meneghiniana.AAC.2
MTGNGFSEHFCRAIFVLSLFPLKTFSSFTIDMRDSYRTKEPSETTKIQTMPPVRNRSHRNGDDPAAAFADLFGAPEDAADFDYCTEI